MSRPAPWGLAAKRCGDLVGAGLGLVLLSPLLAMVALLVRLRLGRPVLFVQMRAGQAGRLIRVHKFRTMLETCGADGNRMPDAQRLTGFGCRLRRWSLDELPQLWDVLIGSLSLVGPRPLLPQYTARYNAEQIRRLELKPGVTGWAQVHGRNAIGWEQRFTLDVWYVDHWSVWLDLRILAKTLRQLVSPAGISAAGQATMTEFLGEPTLNPGPLRPGPRAGSPHP